ncbi:hypothetical protein PUNSTDRAFT_54594 [Punctularia strigosozonata HHB-11173 SS5]|uniref:uncharacterized protein n=1 Tax=Punctularia strigosozonata (strain HHB-11173) TaxID=741275 RepID=UPI000441661B|nr:uncharacterized protein PUNSTDRAFT_54594 [Punctularia strigosozonata HHB-11173 SS5]EIN05667.1 hypothetical protein PUNSTDRAFT_54594 [Punctularia strigosozonata HHB-11173 SS5]
MSLRDLVSLPLCQYIHPATEVRCIAFTGRDLPYPNRSYPLAIHDLGVFGSTTSVPWSLRKCGFGSLDRQGDNELGIGGRDAVQPTRAGLIPPRDSRSDGAALRARLAGRSSLLGSRGSVDVWTQYPNN